MPQGLGHVALALARGQFQNLHVHLVGRLLRVVVAEHVVGDAERARGKHFFAVLIVRKRARLANQRIDDVTIVDRDLLLAHQSRHGLDQVALMRHGDLFGPYPHVRLLADQPAGNGIGVGPHLNRAAAADAHGVEPLVGVEPFPRQGLEACLLFEEPLRAIRVGAGDQLFDETHVLVAAGKITAAAQQQRLVDAVFKMPVGRFDVAVLVGATCIGAFRFATVMIHQRRITIGQRFAVGMIADRRAERIRSMPPRHAAEFPERFLNALAERFKRFGKTQRNRLNVAVGQHAMKPRVVKPLAGDLHAEPIANGEVAGRQSTGGMHLGEEHRLARPMQTSPLGHPSLERATRRIGKPAGPGLLQPVEQGLRFQRRLAGELLLHLAPDVRERIHARPVIAGRFPLGRQPLVVAVLACRFFVHFSHPCRSGQRPAQPEQPPQFLDGTILDHRILHGIQEMR